MSRVFVHGLGTVSSAGWSVESLRNALAGGKPIPESPLERPGWAKPLRARRVPLQKVAGLDHPRLRRCSAVTLYAAAAAKEALADAGMETADRRRTGIIFCVTSGCVQFSRRFYDETWRNPATASPLIFPETVFNAPSSHLAAMLGLDCINYTLVGDPGAFLQALALAAQWLVTGKVEDCLVVGAEEMDWVTADACRHFARRTICSEGAAAVLLSCAAPTRQPGAELIAITNSHLYLSTVSRMRVIEKVRVELPRGDAETLLCDSRQGTFRDAPEAAVWKDWSGPRVSPRTVLGEGLMAGGGWQAVAAIDPLRQGRHRRAIVSAASGHQQAIGASFAACD